MDVHEFDEINEAAVKGWGEPFYTDDTVPVLKAKLAAVRELLNDPVYAQVVVKETPTTIETVRTDPTPLIFAADLLAALDGVE